MNLKIKFTAGISDEVGMRETVITVSSNPNDLLKCLEEQIGFPVRSKVGRSCMVLVNGRSIKKLIQEGAAIQEGDSIMVVPYLSGG